MEDMGESVTLETSGVEYELRYGHSDGHTDVCINSDGRLVVTAGSDGEARLWTRDQDYEDGDSIPVAEGLIHSIVVHGNNLYVASDSHDVKTYSLPHGSYEGCILRFSAEVYHLNIHGTKLAAGGGDFDIKVVDIKEEERNVVTLSGHTAPILSISQSPVGHLLCSSSCDGSVVIWSLTDGKEVHRLNNNHDKSNDFKNSSTLARMSWSPNGKLLAVPGKESLSVLKSSSFSSVEKLSHKQLFSPSVCCFNQDSSLLSVAGKGTVLIYQTTKLSSAPVAVLVSDPADIITSLIRHPAKSDQFLFSNEKGKFSFVKILAAEGNSQSKNETDRTSSFETNDDTASKLDDLYGTLDDDFTEDQHEERNDPAADDDDEEITRSVKKKKPAFIDDEAEDEDVVRGSSVPRDQNDEMDEFDADLDAADFIDDAEIDDDVSDKEEEEDNTKKRKEATGGTTANTVDDNDAVIDIGALKAKYDKVIFGEGTGEGEESKDSKLSDGRDTGVGSSKQVVKTPVIVEKSFFQKPFIPTSTPVHLEQRFMLWNETGIVRGYCSENENTIDVEFHDIAVHHSINMTNSHNYSLAALSPEALVLASGKSDEEEDDDVKLLPSRMFVMNFVTWDEGNKEWSIDLPSGEFAECLAIGSGFIALITNLNIVRLFSVSGIQVGIFCIPGRVVSAAGQENSLMIVFNSAPGVARNPCLSCLIIKVNCGKSSFLKQPTPSPISVSLTPDSLLSWCGFTDEGTPCIIDSKGFVKLFKNCFGNSWIPVKDLNIKDQRDGTTDSLKNLERLNQADHHWVIGLSELNQSIRCIFCKGSRFPAVIPRPQVTQIPFKIPFTGRNTEKGRREEEHFRAKVTNATLEKLLLEGYDVESQLQGNYRSWSESLIRLFAMAVASNCESLAFDISHMMPSTKTVEAAKRYALGKGRRALAEKLQELEVEKSQESDDEGEEPPPEQYVSSPRRTAVPVADNEENTLRPKTSKPSASSSKRRQDEEDDEDEEDVDLRLRSRKKQKPSSDDDSEEEENRNHHVNRKENGFKTYFRSVKDQLEEENPDMDREELKDYAKALFTGLPLQERKQYEKMSEGQVK